MTTDATAVSYGADVRSGAREAIVCVCAYDNSGVIPERRYYYSNVTNTSNPPLDSPNGRRVTETYTIAPEITHKQ